MTAPHSVPTLPQQPELDGGFVAVGPTRVLDTRDGTGDHGVVAKLGTHPLLLDVSGITGNPSVRPTAVVLNVTATNASTASHLTVYPYGQDQPITSNLNFGPGRNVANMVTVPVGGNGLVAFANATGTTDVVADLAGYYTLDKAAATYVPDGPTRLLNTRDGTGTNGTTTAVGAGKSVDLQLSGTHGVPTADVSAVVLNVTATASTTAGHLIVHPQGAALPTASSLNYQAGQTIANLVTVPLGSTGKVSFYNSAGSTHVIADIAGYYLTNSPKSGGVFQSLDSGPTRMLDTRDGTGGAKGPVGAGNSVDLQITGTQHIPSTDVSAVVLNVTAAAPTTGGHLTVYPHGIAVPSTSTLNFAAGQNVPNLVVVPVGADGKISIANSAGRTQVVADVFGYFATGSELSLKAMDFASSTVDASGGGAAVTLDWTVTDSSPAAAQNGGTIVIRQRGTAPDTYVGQSYTVDFLQENSGYGGADFVSGDAAEAHYRYTFAVPRYAGTTTAVWAVSTVSLFEDSQQARQVLVGSELDGYGASVTATEQVATDTPSYQSLTFRSGVSQLTPALYDADGTTFASFDLNVQDGQSGFSNGTATLTGPGARTLTGSFAYQTYDEQDYGECQHQTEDADCTFSVHFPAGYPTGRWSVTAVSLTNNAGQTQNFTGLDEQPFTVTANDPLSASGFTATPNPVNSWWGPAPFTISLHVSGARDGVTSIEPIWDGAPCTAGSATPTSEGNGVYSVQATMDRSTNGQASTCSFGGYVIADGAGDLAVYGDLFGAPDPGLLVKGVPDTVGPTVTSASLSKTSVPSSQLRQVSVEVIAHVTQGTAPADESTCYVYDSTGRVVGSSSGGASVGSDGTMLIDVDTWNLTTGTYTVSFEVTDEGWLSTPEFGKPGGTPPPGGPLTLTVTAG
ncbi:hypothetical protein AB0399_33325 [Streptomyces sp. NPDC088194]|uniref:hypothetical protein n=1 Tax=Streptomyces sp. NPDC088194 TaxID=3154931 RepID=UPI00344FEE4F